MSGRFSYERTVGLMDNVNELQGSQGSSHRIQAPPNQIADSVINSPGMGSAASSASSLIVGMLSFQNTSPSFHKLSSNLMSL